MDSFQIRFQFVMQIIVLPSVLGHGSTVAILEKLQRLDSDVIGLKLQVPGIERKMANELTLAQQYLEAKLMDIIVPKYIDSKVENSLSGILNGRRIEDMVSGYVVNQMNTLRGNLQQMTRKYHTMSRRLRDIEKEVTSKERFTKEQQDVEDLGRVTTLLREDLNTTRETLRDIEVQENQWKERLLTKQQEVTKYTETMDREITLLKEDLKATRKKVMDLDAEREHWKEQCLKERQQVTKDIVRVDNHLREIEKCECQKKSRGSTTLATSPNITSTPTTQLTVERDMDLLIAPHDSQDYLKRLTLNRNSLSNFPLKMVNVDSIIFIPSVRSLLISAHDPHTRLLTFHIDSHESTTVQEDIQSYGMTVDEISHSVFMTVNNPAHSISRIEVNGWGYRVIVNTTSYGSTPYGIAVDPRQRRIYASVGTKLLSVDYDGRNVQTLYTGSSMCSVTMDPAGAFIYFNSDSKLLRKSTKESPQSVTKELFHLNNNPYTMVYYNNSIYTLKSSNDPEVSVVFLGSKVHKIVRYTLQTVTSSGFAMCLIPVVGH